ncbi:hypothetical protein DL96DRAFT_1820809 [Flagelloscypha sp. PMI_526]|nr:hypothetical protein DL96DRAFT_1820809 [Flagelloscypha sp. PMI_526]
MEVPSPEHPTPQYATNYHLGPDVASPDPTRMPIPEPAIPPTATGTTDDPPFSPTMPSSPGIGTSSHRSHRHRHERRPTENYKRQKEREHAARTQQDLIRLLIEAEYENKNLRKSVNTATQSAREELSRALEAERMAKDLGMKLRQSMDEKMQGEQDTARAQDELRLYKLQLDTSKTEVERAQRVVEQLRSERDDAERSAQRARSMARKLDRERHIDAAREEGRRLGFEAGFRRAQDELGFTPAHNDPRWEQMYARATRPREQPTRREVSDTHDDDDDEDDESYSDDEEAYDREPTPPRDLRTFVPPPSSGAPTETPRQSTSYATAAARTRESRPESLPSHPPIRTIPPPASSRQPEPTRGPPVSASGRNRVPSASVDVYSIDIPRASVVEAQGNINWDTGQEPTYTIPPDNFIPSASGDGGIYLPPAHEFTPHVSQLNLPETAKEASSSAPKARESTATAATKPPETRPPASGGGPKHSSWYQAQNSDATGAPVNASQDSRFKTGAPPKRRGSLLGSISRRVGKAFGLRRNTTGAPGNNNSKHRINLDTSSTDSGDGAPVIEKIGTTVPQTETHVVPSVGPVVNPSLGHRRSQSENLRGPGVSGSARQSRYAPSQAGSHRSGRPSQSMDALRYPNPNAVEQWRKDSASAAGSVKSSNRRPAGHSTTPHLMSPGSTSSRRLYVANQPDAPETQHPRRPPLNPAATSGSIGINVEPPSSSNPTTSPNPQSTSMYSSSRTPFIPPATSATSLTSGLKPSGNLASGAPPTPAGQLAGYSRPGSALSNRSRSRSFNNDPNVVPSIRRVPSTSSIASHMTGRSAMSSNYSKFDKNSYLDPAFFGPDDTPTRQNTMLNSGMVSPRSVSGHGFAGIGAGGSGYGGNSGATPGPSRPRSFVGVPGRAESTGTSMYAD